MSPTVFHLPPKSLQAATNTRHKEEKTWADAVYFACAPLRFSMSQKDNNESESVAAPLVLHPDNYKQPGNVMKCFDLR